MGGSVVRVWEAVSAEGKWPGDEWLEQSPGLRGTNPDSRHCPAL